MNQSHGDDATGAGVAGGGAVLVGCPALGGIFADAAIKAAVGAQQQVNVPAISFWGGGRVHGGGGGFLSGR